MNNIQILEQKELPGSLIQIKISVSKELMSKVKESTFKEIAQKVSMPGFRKGKVPEKMIRQNFEKEISDESLNNTLQESSLEAINKIELYPLNTPKLTINQYKPEEELEYTLEFAVYPKVKIGNLKDVKVVEQELSEEDKKLPEGEQHTKQHQYRNEYFNKLIEASTNLMEADIPEAMIDDELSHREKSYKDRLAQLNISIDDFLKASNTTLEDQRKQWRKDSEFVIKQQLFLTQLSKDENIEATEEEVTEEIGKLDKNLQELYTTGSNRAYVAQLIKNQKAFNKLIDITGGKQNELDTHSH